MTASVPWSVSAVDPEAWATARDAARRTGQSVGEWLESAIQESAGERGRPQRSSVRESSHALNRRLDDIAERLDHFARHGEPNGAPARHGRGETALLNSIETLNHRVDGLVRDLRAEDRNGPAEVRAAIQRLDDRIEGLLARGQIGGADPTPELERKLETISHTIETMSRRLERENARYAETPGPSNIRELDDAVAEIMMRQSALDGTPPPQSTHRAQAAAPDFSRLEHQLKAMADEMQALRRAGSQPESMEPLRRELGKLAVQLSELAPRRSIEALERTVESLATRFDRLPAEHSDDALHDVAQALYDIRVALADVRPAESFASVEKDLRELSSKLDGLSVRGVDNSTVARLQEQTAEIRDLLSGALPSDVLKALVEQIEILVHKFENGAPVSDNSIADILNAFDRRMDALAERIDAANRDVPGQAALDDIRARLDQVQRAVAESGRTSSAGVETSLADLSRKVEAAEQRLGGLGAIERGLSDLFAQLQEARSSALATAERAARPAREMAAPIATEYDRPPAIHHIPARQEAGSAPEPVRTATFADAAADAAADYPLEPGSGAPRMRLQSAALRTAQSEAALEGIGAPRPEPSPSRASDFIAAARRAAQAAAAEPAADPAPDRERAPRTSVISLFGGGRRALLIALTAFLLIFTALRFLNGGLPSLLNTAPATPTAVAPQPAEPMRPEPPLPTAPKLDNSSLPLPHDDAIAAAPPAGVIGGGGDMTFLGDAAIDPTSTGSAKTTMQTASAPAGADAAEDASGLPAALGTPGLRAAAAAGHPVATYEIGARYLEGRGVKPDPAEAAKWLERSFDKGFAPAAYRLGNIHEKGHGTAKNLTAAMRYYKIGADAGNIKAMHNLAVMYAEGPDGKPDYKAAAQWFRKAGERGVRDSQYNLGVLYARGLGVEQNLAESYRWFALAADQGDTDSAKKRDDVAKRLDVQTLVAAKLAVQTWASAPIDAAANETALKPEWEKAEAAPPRKRTLKK